MSGLTYTFLQPNLTWRLRKWLRCLLLRSSRHSVGIALNVTAINYRNKDRMKMQLEEAIHHALDGNALLFTGAGFSVGATPVGHDKFLTGRELARYLYDEAKIETNDDQLNIASQIYVKKFDKNKLMLTLKNLFTCKSVNNSHRLIATVPWQVSYTTNYDNVLEVAYLEEGRKLVPILPSSDAKGKILSPLHCVHINGYIVGAEENDLNSAIKLSNSSYLTQAFENSDWAFAFRKSLNIAKVIFFVGYSMYDMDIQRIIHNIGDTKQKTFFIERNDVDENDIEFGIQSDFGNIVPIGIDGFAEQINECRKEYIPNTPNDSIFYLNKIEPKFGTVEFRDNSVFDLFLRAEFSVNLIMESLRGDLPGPYFLRRSLHDKALEAIDWAELRRELKNDGTESETWPTRARSLRSLRSACGSVQARLRESRVARVW